MSTVSAGALNGASAYTSRAWYVLRLFVGSSRAFAICSTLLSDAVASGAEWVVIHKDGGPPRLIRNIDAAYITGWIKRP